MTDTTTTAVDFTAFTTAYLSAEKHAGRAAVVRGQAVNRALLTEGVSLQDLADALALTGAGKVSKATLSNYGRAYREVQDAALPLTVSDAALPVAAVLRAINRGALPALNDWGKTVRSTQTWTPETFVTAIDGLQKSATSRTGKAKDTAAPAPEAAPAGAEQPAASEPTAVTGPPTVDLVSLAATITAVDLAEFMTRVATGRTFSEGETATLFAGMAALTDSLEHADDTAQALATA